VTIHPIENQSVGTQSASFTIIKADATISIHTGTYTKSTGDAAFALTGIHTNSDGKVKYSVTQGKEVVSVNAFGQVTLLKAGTAVIRVSVPATGNYNESTTKTIRILVKDESTKITNTKAKITKTTNKKGKKIALKLSGATQGAGYEIQYGTKSNFKSAKTVKKSSNSVTLNKLKKGKKYFIRVRIYKKIGNDIYYGKWSSKKTVKIKK
jgi:hypothetical protein